VLSFLVLLLAYLFSQFYRAFLAVVATDLTRDLGFGAAELGDLSASWFIAFALAQFPIGYALDHAGPRRTIAGFMALAVAGAALFAAAWSYGSALAGMALIGIGCGPVLMGAIYLFGRSYPPERFAVLSSSLLGLSSIGNLLAATPLTHAVEAFGWRGAMAGIAGATAVAALLVLLLITDPPRLTQPSGGKRGGALADLVTIGKVRALWPIFAMSAVSYAVVAAERGLWIGPFLKDVYGLGAEARGDAAFAMGLAMTVGAIAFGPLERLAGGPKPVVLASGISTGSAFLMLGLLPGMPALGAMACLTLIGGTGLSYAILMAHGRLFYSQALLGRGVTLQNFLFIGGTSVLQAMSGRFVQAAGAAGSPPESAFQSLHLGFGLLLLGASAIYLFAPARPRSGA